MNRTEVSGLDATIQKTVDWLRELSDIGAFIGPQQAYTALHAVLHSLRDVLGVDEAAQLAAGMPMLVRGLFFEGWDPSKTPRPARSKREFLDRVHERLGNPQIDPEHACRSVFCLLERKIADGEIEDVRGAMHHDVRELWFRDRAFE
jgi:uncharacterized protein (DUF2267 family)